jgi:hypothetical protein
MKRYSIPLPVLYLLSITIVGFTLFWGYCWNWWGQAPLWQLLFQSVCPLASDEARYPQNVDVLVSARLSPSAGHPLPSGKYLLYSRMVGENHEREYYTYDFEARTHQQFNPPTIPRNLSLYITDEWMLIQSQYTRSYNDAEYFLVNVDSQQEIPLIEHRSRVDLAREIPADLIALLRASDTVYVKGASILGLPTPLGNSIDPHHLIIGTTFIGDLEYGQKIANHLHTYGITPIVVSSNFSPDGLFYHLASSYDPSSDSIYATSTNEPIVVGSVPNFTATGWAYRQQGIILTAIPTSLLGGSSLIVLFPIPQPILLLRQNSQYLPPDLQAEFAAQDALEARNKILADIVMVVLIVASVGMGLLTARTHLHRRRAEKPVPPQGSYR